MPTVPLAMGFMGIVSLVAVPIVIVLVLGFMTARQNTMDMFDRQTGNVLSEVSQLIAGRLDPVAEQAVYIADMVRTGEIDTSDLRIFTFHLTGALSGMRQVSQLAFIDPRGRILRIKREGRRVKRSDWSDHAETMEMIRNARARAKGYWGEFFFAESSGTTLLNFRMPLWRDGKFRGVLIAVVSTRSLSDFISDISARRNVSAFVLQGSKHVLAHPGMDALKFDASDAAPLPSIAQFGDPVLTGLLESREWLHSMKSASDSRRNLTISVNRTEHAVSYRALMAYGSLPWIVGVSIPHSQIGTEIGRVEMIAWLGLSIFLLSVILAYWLGRSLTTPVRQLAAAASSVFAFDGKPTAHAPLKRSRFRELDEATSAVNSLLSGLFWFNTYLPRTIVKRLMRGNFHSVDPEERVVTVMFTDIYGYSNIAERQTPKRVMEFLNEHFTILAGSVELTDGTVDKYIGDSMMAFWGAPDDQPDHAERAFEAALDIASKIRKFNIERNKCGKPEVRLRIGLHTGPAVVGNIGAPGRVNYTIVGDTVNIAQRIESLSKELHDDTRDAVILMSSTTIDAVGGGLQDFSVGTHTLSGHRDEVEIFRLG